MTIEDDAVKCMIELREFYEPNDLANYVEMCTTYKLPHYECALFLRGQTVADYTATTRVPNVAEMAVRTYVWYQNTLIGGKGND